ncbi:hypothetical protein GCM10009416_41610 [Craurococcus roseus]|uniref:DUF2946 domain-containing protein n=1 Tax=Craurococcus roseus TaxID=77585 RepID=A0ABN1FWX6_9PROT
MEKGRAGQVRGRAEPPGRAPWFLRIAARLVIALAVLALPVASPPAMAGAGGRDHHHAVASDCDAAGPAAATPASHRGGHRDGDGHHAPATAAACCPASQCPVPLGALPPTPARASPLAGGRGAAFATGPRLQGLDGPPALPPPRAASTA